MRKRIYLLSTCITWDFQTGKQLHTRSGPKIDWGSLAAITPDAKRAILRSPDRFDYYKLEVWDLENGNKVCELNFGRRLLTALAVSPDSSQVLLGTYEGMLKAWDVRTGHERLTLQGDDPNDVFSRRNMSVEETVELMQRNIRDHGPQTGARAATFTPDNRHTIVAHKNGLLKLWDLESGEEKLLKDKCHGLRHMAIMPNGRRAIVAIGYWLDVWDIFTGSNYRLVLLC
jgi:WD40 repeat protein